MDDVRRDLPELRKKEQLAEGVSRHPKGPAKGREGEAGELVALGGQGCEQGIPKGGLGMGGCRLGAACCVGRRTTRWLRSCWCPCLSSLRC
eukprot:1034991-Pelagomonas_calceolata.AAC.1